MMRRRTWVGLAALVTVAVVVVGAAVAKDVSDRAAAEAAAAAAKPAVLPTTAAAVAAKLPVRRPQTGPLRVVFAGDSLTFGLYASSESAGFRPQVVSALEMSGPVQFTRGGQTGNRVKQVSDSIVFGSGASLIILELGTNDAYKTSPGDFAAQYRELVAKANREAPGASIVCLGIWGNSDAANVYDPAISAACRSVNGAFLQLADLFERSGDRGPAGQPKFGGVSDNFHPNDVGYKAIADRIVNILDVSAGP